MLNWILLWTCGEMSRDANPRILTWNATDATLQSLGFWPLWCQAALTKVGFPQAMQSKSVRWPRCCRNYLPPLRTPAIFDANILAIQLDSILIPLISGHFEWPWKSMEWCNHPTWSLRSTSSRAVGAWSCSWLLWLGRQRKELQQLTDEIEHRISFDSLDDISRHLYDWSINLVISVHSWSKPNQKIIEPLMFFCRKPGQRNCRPWCEIATFCCWMSPPITWTHGESHPRKVKKCMGNEKYVYNIFGQTPNSNSINQSLPPRALSLSLSQSMLRIYDHVWDFNSLFQGTLNLRGLPEFLGLAVGSCLCPVPWQDKESVEWLSEYLRSMTRTTLMVISHDPTFLNKVCTDIIQPLALNYLMISSLGCRWSETQGSYKAFCLLPCPTLTAGTRNPELPLEGRPRHMAWCF